MLGGMSLMDAYAFATVYTMALAALVNGVRFLSLDDLGEWVPQFATLAAAVVSVLIGWGFVNHIAWIEAPGGLEGITAPERFLPGAGADGRTCASSAPCPSRTPAER